LPQLAQNRESSGFSCPQWVQKIVGIGCVPPPRFEVVRVEILRRRDRQVEVDGQGNLCGRRAAVNLSDAHRP